MKWFIILPCLLFAGHSMPAQNALTIIGYVEDATTGEKLIGANVFDPVSETGTATNTYGFYSLTIPEGKSTLQVSYIGYESKVAEIFPGQDTIINFSLVPSQVLATVEVTANSHNINDDRMNVFRLPLKQIRGLPALGGEIDIVKALHLLPGVKFGMEGTSGFFVRGGSPDQNLILLDGVPVYNATHLFNFVSIFNPAGITNIELVKGGFPARYGGRLASVLDIRTKEGNMKKWHGEGTVGIVSSKLMLEGPVIKDKCSFVLSGRRSLYEVYTIPASKRAQGEESDEFTNFYFYDINAKINYRFSNEDRVYLSYYQGRDKYRMEQTFEDGSLSNNTDNNIKWGSSIWSARWNHLWGKKLFSNLNLYRNDYRFLIRATETTVVRDSMGGRQRFEQNFGFDSKILDYGLQADFFYTPTSRHNVKFGAGTIRHRFVPGVIASKVFLDGVPEPASDTAGTNKITAQEARAYAEDHFRLSEKLVLNAGLHASLFILRGKKYHSLEPRLSTRYSLTERTALKVSYSKMQQYIHLLTNSGIGLPTDLWVPPTQKVPPQQSEQVAVEVAFIPNKKYELTIGTYGKKMVGLIDYREGASFLIEGRDWEDKVAVNGKGKAYGIELFVQKNAGRMTGWVGYTLAWANRQFDDINGGRAYPFKYDRRHDLSIAGFYKVSSKLELSIAWVFATGNAVTLPRTVYPSILYPPDINLFSNFNISNGLFGLGYPVRNSYQRQPTDIFVFGDKNSNRLPPYHRLDVGARFHKKKKRAERTWSLGVYNLYNRKNPYYIRYVQSGGSALSPFEAKGSFQLVSLFQFIPSVSYSLRY